VLVVSSGVALRSFPWGSVYGATKAAQRMFAEALRHELSGTGVSVTVVYPGGTDTGFHDHERPDRMPDWTDRVQKVTPEGVAAAALEGVEEDARSVYHPANVQLLGAVHGVSPKAADAILRRMLGGTAAPRRD
jgi:short-subunit dehydrogenase